jgi:hypothetical protein
MVFKLGDLVPWFRMSGDPGVAIIAPTGQNPERNRVSEAPCDEYKHRILLPVGEMIEVFPNGEVRIKKTRASSRAKRKEPRFQNRDRGRISVVDKAVAVAILKSRFLSVAVAIGNRGSFLVSFFCEMA